MVEHFVSDFYHAKPKDLSDIVTSSFTFRSPLSEQLSQGYELNFAQYMDYSSRYFNVLKAKQQKITSEDDITFKVNFILEILSFDNSFLKEVSGITTVTIKDNLVDKVEVAYQTETGSLSQLKNIISKIKISD